MADAERLITLAIETSNPSASSDGSGGQVALGEASYEADRLVSNELLGIERLTPAFRHDDALMPAIDRLFSQLGLAPRDVDRVAVSVGPGGFTSLRIAIATGKMIAEAAGAPTVGVPSAEVAAGEVMAGERPPRRFAVALASKRDSAWIAIFDSPTRRIPKPIGRLMTVEELAGEDASSRLEAIVADAHLPPLIREWVRRRGLRIIPPRLLASRCFEASLARQAEDPQTLSPIYPREPEAVSKWRARRGGA